MPENRGTAFSLSKNGRSVLLFDFLWVKNEHKKENCPGTVLFACNVWLRKRFSDPFPDGSAAYIGNFNALCFQIVTDLICFRKVFGFLCFISF